MGDYMAYTAFAQIYDEFMDDIPYEKWASFIENILKNAGITAGILCDLGCGTGVMTRLMADKGFDMIGIDLSEEMLLIAREEYSEKDILYLNQDMKDMELFGTVNAFISVCDSMNYITEENDMVEVLRKANNYLEKDGLFIFDMKTPHFYENILGNKTMMDDREDATLIWDNYYDAQSGLNYYDLTMFFMVEEDDEAPLFEKYQENHVQRAYSVDEMKEIIIESGMELVAMYDERTSSEVNDTTERIYYVLKETFQKGKYYE